MAYRDFDVSLKTVGQFIDPISDLQSAGIITSGSVLWVKSPTDADYTSFKDRVGKSYVFDTIQAGINAARSDRNDYLFVVPKDDGGAWTMGTALDITKDRLHLISLGYTKALNGYSNTIQYNMGTSPDTELVHITGHAVEIAGFRILGTLGTNAGGTMSNGLVFFGTASTGTAHQAWIHDCVIEANHSAGTPPLIASKNSINGVRFDNVSFEAASDSPENGLVVLPNSGARWEFHNSKFVMNALATTDNFIQAGTGANEYTLFRNCEFINVNTGTVPASGVVGSVTVNNPVILSNCSYVNASDAGTDTGVFVVPAHSGTIGAAYNSGIAIGTALGVAA